MKLKAYAFLIITTATLLAPTTSLADNAAKKAAVTNMVRALGYGGAIHHFKNYVLRGTDKYHVKAGNGFKAASDAIAAYRNAAPTEAEKATLKEIEGVITQYQDALSVVQTMVAEKKSAKEIDGAVKINDGPATTGIAKLREGQEWSPLADAEYALGYGCGIHQFKNYVLRGDDRRQKVEVCFMTAESAVGYITNKDATKGLLKVIGEYKAALSEIAKMVAASKSAEEIDGSVKIDDSPAIKDLETLRK